MKRTAATLLLINMKTKRIRTRNSTVKSSSVYLPDECWELIFKHLPMDDQHYHSLSLVSKQFLSVTNRLRSSLTIKSDDDHDQVLNLIGRFPNLTSLNFCAGFNHHHLDYILSQLPIFPFRLTSLKLSNISTIPATGLVSYSTKRSLNSLTCSYTDFLHSSHMFLIADCFPYLHHLDLSYCDDIYEYSIPLLLKRLSKIKHLNLTGSSMMQISSMMNFQVPTLEVLNLSYAIIDDHTLNVITKTCTGILQLSLKYCDLVRDKGVKRALRNCKKLREINLKHCPRVVDVNVDSMLLLRPSLTKIKLPSGVAWLG